MSTLNPRTVAVGGPPPGGWSVKREISLGDLIAIVFAVGSIVVAYGRLDSKIAYEQEMRGEVVKRLDRLESKLDRVLDHTRSPDAR